MARRGNGYVCYCKYCGDEFTSWDFLQEVCKKQKCRKLYKKSLRANSARVSIEQVVRLAYREGVHYGQMSLFVDEGIKTW